jgi:hypothetical protein
MPCDVRGVQPDRGELIPPIGHPYVHVPAGPAERDCLELLLAVVGPDDAGDDGHRLVEGVLGLACARVVEDALTPATSRPAAGRTGPRPIVEQVFECV